MSARPSATPCVSMKPRRQAQAPAANEANSKGKSHEGSGEGRHRHRRRHPDRAGVVRVRGYGVRVAVLDVDGAGGERSPPQTRKAAAPGRSTSPTTRAGTVRGRGRQALRPAGLPWSTWPPPTWTTARHRAARTGCARWTSTWCAGPARARAPPLWRRRHRQLHQHLGQGRADGPLALSGVQGRAGAAHATWRWTSPATASASIRCRQAGPGRA